MDSFVLGRPDNQDMELAEQVTQFVNELPIAIEA